MPLYASLVRTSSLLLVGLGVALMASVYMARRVVRPLQALRLGVERIGGGDLDFRIQIRTGDEIESLADEFNKMAQQQKAMTRFGQALASEHTLDAVCREFAAGIRGFVPYDRVVIGRIGPNEIMEVLFLLSPASDESPEKLHENFARHSKPSVNDWVMQHRCPFVREDTSVVDDFETDRRLSRMGVRSYILVPLFHRGVLVGRLHLGSLQPATYQDRHVAFLMAAGEWLAMAIENARLYEQVRNHADHLASAVDERTKELLAANERLRDLDRMKSQFLARVSHELRTPLTSIKGSVDNMLDGLTGPLSEKQLQYARRIQVNSDRLVSFINDILDLSAIEAGRLELRQERLAIGNLAHEVVEGMKPMIDQKNIMIQVVAPPTPECERSDEV